MFLLGGGRVFGGIWFGCEEGIGDWFILGVLEGYSQFNILADFSTLIVEDCDRSTQDVLLTALIHSPTLQSIYYAFTSTVVRREKILLYKV